MRVGIDLGTTYSLVAKTDPDGRAILLPDNSDSDTFHTPSVVLLSGGSAIVGSMAEMLLTQNPELKVIRFFKRRLGELDPVSFDEHGNPWYAETISALVLKKLRFDAETYTSQFVDRAVITVPAHFNDPQRRAVLNAAMLADIPLLGLVEEPVAAAIHYGVSVSAHNRIILVYDFGGGTFDATILSLDSKGVYVLAKSGITDVGGKELDEAVGQIVLENFERANGKEPALNARSLLELRRASEEIKIALCMPGRTSVRQTVLLGADALEVVVRRADFEPRIRSFLERTEREVVGCVREAGLQLKDVDLVLMVGGSSMVPAVQERLRQLFPGDKQILFHEPSRAVALGAALHASQLAGDAERYNIPPEFRGVTGAHVGIRAVDPTTGRMKIEMLIKKNMPLPVIVKKSFFTTRTDQVRMVLEFVQYSGPEEKIVSIGQLMVGPLPSPRINYPIEVTVENREDGTIGVTAYDAQTGVELSQVFGREADGKRLNLAAQRALVRSTFINNL
jgi:molecular chaperone DnaK (HSP70)